MKYKKFAGLTIVLGIGLLAIGTMAASAEATEDPLKSVVLVESVDFKITVAEYLAIASTQSPSAQREAETDGAKRMALLDKMINVNVLAAEAARRGYDENPEVVTVKKNRLATLMHNEISKQFDADVPSDEDLKKYYDDNIDKYNKPEKVRARHILISDKQKAQQLLAKLKKEEVSQYQFRKIAKEQSEDLATKSKGGDLTFITKDELPESLDPALVQAAFQIKNNGAIYPLLVETEKGFHLLMRTGHRKAMNLSFEDAKIRLEKLVQRQLHKEKTESAIKDLQTKYKVELFEENLKHVVIDLTKASAGPAASLPQRRRMRR